MIFVIFSSLQLYIKSCSIKKPQAQALGEFAWICQTDKLTYTFVFREEQCWRLCQRIGKCDRRIVLGRYVTNCPVNLDWWGILPLIAT